MRSIRSAGHWLVLGAALAACFAAAVEGRVGRVAVGGLVVLLTGILVTASARVLYLRCSSGAPWAPRAVRAGVPMGLVIAGGASAAVVIEGRAGPATLATIVVLGIGALVVISAALLFERDAGEPLLPATYRVGIPLLALMGPALGAVVVLEGGVGPATMTAIAVVVLTVALCAWLSLDHPTWPRHHERSRRVRTRVAATGAVLAAVLALIALEGGIGPLALSVLAGLALLTVLRRLPGMLRVHRRAAAPSVAPARLGIAMAVVFLLGVAALAASLDSSPSELSVAAGDVATEGSGEPPAPARPATWLGDRGPHGEGAGTTQRWDTLGNPFVNGQCSSRGPLEHGGVTDGAHHGLDPFVALVVHDELDAARAHALAHPAVADAEAAGYRRATDVFDCVGAAYVRWNLPDDLGWVDPVFDPGRPEVLRYAGTAPEAPIVGVGYLVIAEERPAGFAGHHDRWHALEGTCVTGGVITGVGVAHEECRAQEQAWLAGDDLWTVAAWVAPGWENPHGAFAPGHPALG